MEPARIQTSLVVISVHFLWIDDVIYMIDDLKTHDVGHFEWLWHPGGEAEKTWN